MPHVTPNMKLPTPTIEDVDGYIERMRAKWLATRNRQVLMRSARTLMLMASLAVDPTADPAAAAEPTKEPA